MTDEIQADDSTHLWNGLCIDRSCYRGAEGSGGPGGAMVFKDGPCDRVDPPCAWPKKDGEYIKPRPHYTDNPTPPVVDAGAIALAEKLRKAA